ncbi:MAG: RagB/SusD family nutrient uptake outer membrane protein [Massilibacteroides sp.]|nr:RagB/SusD family nutrient uptake outer membrane protein [Massilibacteroides sp.]
MKIFFLPVIALFLFASCDKDENQNRTITKKHLQGKIEKGPFITGSKVTLYELNEQLQQTGTNIFSTETTDDIGSFSFDTKMSLTSPFVEIEISGYFFNEYRNSLSDSQIKLNALADITQKEKINVNILTHLEYKRIKKLVTEEKSFAEAKKQAQKELLNSFFITQDFSDFEDISFTDNSDASTALLAISSVLLEGKKESEFSQFIAMLSNNFAENGKIEDNTLLNEIKYSNANINSETVKENLVNYYHEKGYTLELSDVWKYIDRNGDGTLNEEDKFINEPSTPLPEESIFEKEENTQSILTNTYEKVRSYVQYVLVLDAKRSKGETIDESSSYVQNAFAATYRAIHQLNFILEGLNRESLLYDPKPYIATAKTLRALLYIDMVQHWGDMPLITKTMGIDDNIYVSRTPKNDIFTYLENDLADVKQYLPNEVYSYSNPVIPAPVADAILTTISLEKGNNASIYLDNLLNCSIFELENQTTDVYNSLTKEIILGIITSDDQPPFSTELKKGKYLPIFSYSGILLNYAENLLTQANTSKALEVINSVRTAKGMESLTDNTNLKKDLAATWNNVPGLDYGYFTLVKRLNLATEFFGLSEHFLLLPIPLSELNLNPNMTQNPGY